MLYLDYRKDLRGTDLAVGKAALHCYPLTNMKQEMCFNVMVSRLSSMSTFNNSSFRGHFMDSRRLPICTRMHIKLPLR